MKTEIKIILLLVFLSPVLGELLSASAPPLEFFTFPLFFLLVGFYGGATLLIREARTRLGLQWSVVFLAIAYGILEEGLMVQSFFNWNHADLNALQFYGYAFGVHWPWAIMLIVYHASISTLIPITMIDLLFPEYKQTPLLRKKGLILTAILVSFIVVFIMMSVWALQPGFDLPYTPNPVLLLGSLCVIFLCIFAAWYFRNHRITMHKPLLLPPIFFGVAGVVIQGSVLFGTYAFASWQVPSGITVGIQFLGIFVLIVFCVTQFLHQNISYHQIMAFLLGSVLFWILLTPLHEFLNHLTGMFVVGLVMFLLLIWWRQKVIHQHQEPPLP